MPLTFASGCSSAKSIAQIPVPVPMSSTLWRVALERGERKSLPERVREKM